VNKIILTSLAFQIVHNLRLRGLTHVDDGLARVNRAGFAGGSNF
ncbi:hypothetical protein C8J31_1735, partial [Rhizobium sp. PP-CC-2G-626]